MDFVLAPVNGIMLGRGVSHNIFNSGFNRRVNLLNHGWRAGLLSRRRDCSRERKERSSRQCDGKSSLQEINHHGHVLMVKTGRRKCKATELVRSAALHNPSARCSSYRLPASTATAGMFTTAAASLSATAATGLSTTAATASLSAAADTAGLSATAATGLAAAGTGMSTAAATGLSAAGTGMSTAAAIMGSYCAWCAGLSAAARAGHATTAAGVTAAAAGIVTAIGHAAAAAAISSAAILDEAMTAPAVAVAPASPWAHAQEDAVIEIPRSVKTHGSAGVGRVVVVAPGTDRLNANPNHDLRVGRWRQGHAG
jgi:hypothetical protein